MGTERQQNRDYRKIEAILLSAGSSIPAFVENGSKRCGEVDLSLPRQVSLSTKDEQSMFMQQIQDVYVFRIGITFA